MNQKVLPIRIIVSLIFVFRLLLPGDVHANQPGRSAGDGIIVGMEYAPVDNPAITQHLASAFSKTGLPGMKLYPDAVAWGEMQSGPDQPLDFTKLDRFVREYQSQGFTSLCVALNSRCRWGCKGCLALKLTNASPKPQMKHLYENWISQIVGAV